MVRAGPHCQRRREPARVSPGELSVACLPVFSQSFLPLLLQPFLARYPDVSLNIVPQESPLLEEWLSAQRHDLGLTETLSTPAGTERTPLLTCNEVCVMPEDHPLASKTVLTPADFQGRITSACRVPIATGNCWMRCLRNIR